MTSVLSSPDVFRIGRNPIRPQKEWPKSREGLASARYRVNPDQSPAAKIGHRNLAVRLNRDPLGYEPSRPRSGQSLIVFGLFTTQVFFSRGCPHQTELFDCHWSDQSE